MWDIQVETGWLSTPGNNDMAIAVRYPADWSDATWQDDANIPSAPNSFIARGVVDDETLKAIYADSDFEVLSAVEVDAPEPGRVVRAQAGEKPPIKDPKEAPPTAERTALRNKLAAKGYSTAALNRALRAGDKREQWIEGLKVEMRTFPRAKGQG